MNLLRELKLDGIADAFVDLEQQDRARDLGHAEWLALLLDRESASRSTRRFETRLRAAHLRHGQASVEDVDFRTPRKLDKALLQQLATCRWITEHHNLLLTGPCGVGKSWLACALAQKACRDGHSVHYARVPRLFADLELAHDDGRFGKLFRTLTRVDLLILDDWGPDRLSAAQRRDLMEIIEDRYGSGTTLITTTGGLIGARLIERGVDVTFCTRPERKAQLMTTGLTLSSPFGRFRRPACTITPDVMFTAFVAPSVYRRELAGCLRKTRECPA